MSVLPIKLNRFILCVVYFVLWIQASRGLKCWECTWDKDYKEERKKIEDEEEKPKPTEETEKEDAIHNPSAGDMFGTENWNEPVTWRELVKYCKNCTEGDVCAKWSFRFQGSTDYLKNVTRMCGRTASDLGCYKQNMNNGWEKEVCLCKGNNCNSAVATSVGIKLIAILFVSYLVIYIIS